MGGVLPVYAQVTCKKERKWVGCCRFGLLGGTTVGSSPQHALSTSPPQRTDGHTRDGCGIPASLRSEHSLVSELEPRRAPVPSLRPRCFVACCRNLKALRPESLDVKLAWGRAWSKSRPKTVATECSFIKRGRDYLITASGGVQIDAMRFASNTQISKHTAQVRANSPVKPNRWWW